MSHRLKVLGDIPFFLANDLPELLELLNLSIILSFSRRLNLDLGIEKSLHESQMKLYYFI